MDIKTKLLRRKINNHNLLKHIDLPDLLKRIYLQRNIHNINEIKLNLRDLLSYKEIVNIEKVIYFIIQAFKLDLKFIIIGDFDVDGAASTALMVLALKKIGVKNIDFIIPNRLNDGYGLSTIIVKKAILLGAQIIITVDNGISSFDGVSLANKENIPVIIIDHHLPKNHLPNTNFIINPHLNKCDTHLKSLSGVGITFYTIMALYACLKKDNWFKEKKINIPKLTQWLDLVVLGTIADSVQLNLNNRILVYYGLKIIRSNLCCLGLRILIKMSNININNLCVNDLNFILNPKLNAAGRLSNMSIVVLLFLTDNLEQAKNLVNKLDTLNQLRYKMQKNIEIKAMLMCKKIKFHENNKNLFGLILYDNKWHQGLLGIIASKIKEKFYQPAIVFTDLTKENLIGSGRSIPGLDIFTFIKELNSIYPNLILDFGGHPMAIGITIKKSKFNKFSYYFRRLLYYKSNFMLLENVIWSDGELSYKELSIKNAEILRYVGPWGPGFPEPIFDGEFCILQQILICKKHLKLILKSIVHGKIVDGIIFNVNTKLWPNNKISNIKILYKLELNLFFNKKLQLLICYIWPL